MLVKTNETLSLESVTNSSSAGGGGGVTVRPALLSFEAGSIAGLVFCSASSRARASAVARWFFDA